MPNSGRYDEAHRGGENGMRERILADYLKNWSADQQEDMWSGRQMIAFAIEMAEAEISLARREEREACARISAQESKYWDEQDCGDISIGAISSASNICASLTRNLTPQQHADEILRRK